MARLIRDIAYVRSGDKGDTATIGLIARAPDLYGPLLASVSPERVAALFGDWVRGPIHVYPMDNIAAVVIHMEGALGGGATRTLRLDQTGKALGNAVLRLPVAEDGAS